MDNELSLTNMGLRYKTDKNSTYRERHDYLPLYERYLRTRRDASAVCEIGIYGGMSLRLWAEYFPKAQVYGVDINPHTLFKAPRITTLLADQSRAEEIHNRLLPYAPFDMIVDDGGHTMAQQQISLGALFPLVKPGGLYVIEDLHTSHPEHVNPFNKTHTMRTTLFAVQQLHSTGIFSSDFVPDKAASYVSEHTNVCNVECGRISEIAFIIKR